MRRNRSGFTLAEVLITVAIIAVLAAVAVPSVIALRKNLNMAELNAGAREIFLSAQHNLTQRKAAGTVANLSGGTEADGILTLQSGTAGAQQLLPAGSVDASVDGGYYVLRFNKQAAVMVEVFYSRDPFTTEELTAINNGSLSGSGSTAAQARREADIGYYRGDATVTGGVTQLLSPQISIVNDNDLVVTVIVPDYLKQIETYGATLTVRVEEIGAPEHSCTISGLATDCMANYGTVNVTLDSLTDRGKAFTTVCSGITPGADIKVTATLSAPNQAGVSYISASASASCNSLFERRETVDGKDTVYISNPRHLQNLNAGFSGLSIPDGETVYVEQTRNITWPSGVEYQSIAYYYGEIGGFDGKGLGIRDLKGKNGLFAYAASCTFKDIHIVNPMITMPDEAGTQGQVGALVGYAMGCSISGCQVYCADYLPGLLNQYGITNNNLAAYSSTGGLLGVGYHVTITNCFSALPHITGGGSIGGLAGNLEPMRDQGSSVTGCYAVVEQLSGTPALAAMLVGNTTDTGVTIQNCYAVGNIAITSDTATISGFANGRAVITDSYCAVTYNKADGTATGVQPAYGFASGGDNTCAYRSGSFTVKNAENAAKLSQRDLENRPGTKLNAAQSHPYLDELTGKAYPFPAISGLPHYGSWPEQNVDGIRLYDSKAGSKELSVILVPVNGSATFWAEARSGGQPAKVEPEVGDINGTTLTRIDKGTYDSATGRKPVTVIAGRKADVTYVDVSADGVTLRVVVVVYDVSLTLTGRTAGGTDVVNTASSGTLNEMSLKAGNGAKFSAELTVKPVASQINESINILQNNLSGMDGIELSTPESYQILDEDWRGFRVVRVGAAEASVGPGVTVNPAIDAAQNIYTLSDQNGTIGQYPVASGTVTRSADGSTATSAPLNILGQSAGRAQVSVSWAMQDSVTAACPVRVSGVQVAIKSLSVTEGSVKEGSVTEEGGRDLGSAKEYPYLLAIRPAPKKGFILKLTAQLFGNPPAGATNVSYSWTVSKSSGDVVGSGTGENPKIPITDQEPQANYRIKLVYSYQTADGNTYATSDFMHLTVTRVTTKDVADSNSVTVTLPDGATQIRLEQIDWGVEVPAPSGWRDGQKLNVSTVYGQVEGSADTQLEWYLKKDSYNYIEGSDDDIRITGQEGSLEVKGPGGEPIAALNWSPEEVPGKSRGGQVTITALDSSYYGTDEHPNGLEFTLIARARDNSVKSEEKEVKVTILPKLRITPQSKVALVSYIFGNAQAQFQSNRIDTRWTETWSVPNGLNKSVSGDKKTLTVSTSAYVVKDYLIALQYGPYQAEAVFTTKPLASEGVTSSINRDGTYYDNGTEISYVLVKKGETKSLVFSWYYAGPTRITSGSVPVQPQEFLEITGDKSNSFDNGSEGRSHQYVMTGKKFSEEAIPLSWSIVRKKYTLWGGDVTETHDDFVVYVIGTEFSERKLVVGRGEDAKQALTLSSYFPSVVADNGTVTITVSAEDIVSLSGSGVTQTVEDGKTVYSYTAKDKVDRSLTVTGIRYGKVVLTATYKVDGRTYTDSCVVSVEPDAGTLGAWLEPCSTGEDMNAIKELFDLDSLPAYAATYAEYGGEKKLTLLTDPVFGHDTLYLKAYVREKVGADDYVVVSADPNVYDAAFASGNSYVATCVSKLSQITAEDGSKAYCYYLKIQGQNGMKEGEKVKITATFGTLTSTVDVWVYSQPSVVFDGGRETDGHTVIDTGNFNDWKTGTNTFSAHLEPLLEDKDGNALDSLKWYLEYPEKENDAGFLTLSTEEGPATNVAILANPWLKVAVTAQSKVAYEAALAETDPDQKWILESTSVAAHALVFLPDNQS